jgi:hypothetical protein
MKKTKQLIHELKHHAPFTLIATVLGIIIVLFIKYILALSFEQEAFEILHPIHIIASAAVSAGIFYKYKKSITPALIVGIFSAILIGSLSDIILPYLGGISFGLQTNFHLPIIEKPLMILSSAIIGSLIGISTKLTKLPHLLHVAISIFASLFYLLAFSTNFNPLIFILATIIVFIAVLIPCCISDILLPFFFLGKSIKQCSCKH